MAKKRKGKKGKKPAPVTASRAYEAAIATPSRRPVIGAEGSQDQQAEGAGDRVRNWGRFLDQNHDIAAGVLDELVKQIVGGGIVTIPKPLTADGEIDEALAEDITEVWRRWTRTADVTGELSWHDAQRVMCRGWLRDGEQFLQHVQGRARGYPFAPSQVPYRIELLESELVPWELNEDGWRQGVRHDTWRRPLAYAVYLQHPGDRVANFLARPVTSNEIKVVPVEQMTHLKNVKRWPATRGESLFATVISRLYDIKDLEESERVKNRVLASWVAAVTKAPELIGVEDTSSDGRRFMEMFEGNIIDSLAPGEGITGVGPDYPVSDMPDHIADQIRRVASGTGTRYSSVAKRYDGNYAAQRQEMVESQGLYQMREDCFVEHVCRSVYLRFLQTAFLDGQIVRPPNFDIERASNAEYRGPITPWIDPLKEVQADALAVEKGFVSLEQVQIKRGASPEIIGKKPEPAAPAPAPAQLTLIDDEEDDAA